MQDVKVVTEELEFLEDNPKAKVALAVIYLEKHLLTTLGFTTFKILIPLVVLVFFLWLVKVVLGIDVSASVQAIRPHVMRRPVK